MKYERTDRFKADYRRRLTEEQREMFRETVRRHFHPAAERWAANPDEARPRGLRVKDVEGAPGIWQMTWSFAGPDGRATFEWIEIDGEPAIRWRRIGDHSIFGKP